MNSDIIGEISNIEMIAVGSSIRKIPRLRKAYGAGRCRKLKGMATVRLSDDTIHEAEVHWLDSP